MLAARVGGIQRVGGEAVGIGVKHIFSIGHYEVRRRRWEMLEKRRLIFLPTDVGLEHLMGSA